ncbi:MAG: hypothetical protein ACLS9T_08130 [Streptococcus salivarius]
MQELTAFGFNPNGLVNETPAVPTYQVKNYQGNPDDFEPIDDLSKLYSPMTIKSFSALFLLQ